MSPILRVLGMILIAAGIVLLLVVGALTLITSQDPNPLMIGATLCIAPVPLAVIAGGISLLRRTESAEQTHGIPDDPETMQDLLDEAEYRSFSLSRLNRLGWFLLFTATALIVAQIVLIILFGREIDNLDSWMHRWIARGFLVLPLFVMIGVRVLLSRFGISIYRR